MMTKWKVLFLSLATVNFIGLILLIYLVMSPATTIQQQSPLATSSDGVELKIQTNKEDLNQIISQYIRNTQGTSHYKVFLKDEIYLQGMIKAFNSNLDLTLTFEPEIQKNGDLLLRQKGIFLGRLQLPASFVLNYIQNNYSLPEWITIHPDKKVIYLALQNVELGNFLHIKMKTFDLKNDQIEFSLAPID